MAQPVTPAAAPPPDMPKETPLSAPPGTSPCSIKVVGVGGGGGNTINRMAAVAGAGGFLEFVAVNTDVQALAASQADVRVQIGDDGARGLGAGGIPAVGRASAIAAEDDLYPIVAGVDMVFVTAGMGGGTGSGAAPVVAELAKSAGCLTVGIVTKPFSFEGQRRMNQALEAINTLQESVDILVTVSNDKLLEIVPEGMPLQEAFSIADEILRQGIMGISEIIAKPGLINVDFADVRSVMQDAGPALMGIGTGSGKTRARDAAVAAISSPLLDFPIEKVRARPSNTSTWLTQHPPPLGALLRALAAPSAELMPHFASPMPRRPRVLSSRSLATRACRSKRSTRCESAKQHQDKAQPRQQPAGHAARSLPHSKHPPSQPLVTSAPHQHHCLTATCMCLSSCAGCGCHLGDRLRRRQHHLRHFGRRILPRRDLGDRRRHQLW